jgi:hypothetical protein
MGNDKNTSVILPIIDDDNKVKIWFVKLNRKITQRIDYNNQNLTNETKMALIEKLWYELYKCKIVKDSNNKFIGLEFESTRDFQIFLLRL